MTVMRSPDNAVDVVVTDTIATVCSGTSSTMTGAGSVDGDRMVIPAPDYRCDDGSEPHLDSGETTSLNEFLRNLTYVRDPERDILIVAGTDVWHRPNAAAPTLEPIGTPMAAESPTSSQSPRPSRRPGDATFTSTIHGISLDYPSGWQTRLATEPWTGGPLSFDSPAADVIFDPTLGDSMFLILASQPYGSLSEDEWRSEQDRLLCPDGGAFGSWSVDGADAFARACSGDGGYLVFTDTRGYLLWKVVSGDEPELDWDWLPVLETVDLHPEDALDASPNPSPSPSASPPSDLGIFEPVAGDRP